MSQLSTATPEADRELSQRVHLFLSGRSQPALRNLEVAARAGTVLLRGRVRSFYHRQLALELTRRVAGVIQIVDELIVDDRATTPATSQLAIAPIDVQGFIALPTPASR